MTILSESIRKSAVRAFAALPLFAAIPAGAATVSASGPQGATTQSSITLSDGQKVVATPHNGADGKPNGFTITPVTNGRLKAAEIQPDGTLDLSLTTAGFKETLIRYPATKDAKGALHFASVNIVGIYDGSVRDNQGHVRNFSEADSRAKEVGNDIADTLYRGITGHDLVFDRNYSVYEINVPASAVTGLGQGFPAYALTAANFVHDPSFGRPPDHDKIGSYRVTLNGAPQAATAAAPAAASIATTSISFARGISFGSGDHHKTEDYGTFASGAPQALQAHQPVFPYRIVKQGDGTIEASLTHGVRGQHFDGITLGKDGRMTGSVTVKDHGLYVTAKMALSGTGPYTVTLSDITGNRDAQTLKNYLEAWFDKGGVALAMQTQQDIRAGSATRTALTHITSDKIVVTFAGDAATAVDPPKLDTSQGQTRLTPNRAETVGDLRVSLAQPDANPATGLFGRPVRVPAVLSAQAGTQAPVVAPPAAPPPAPAPAAATTAAPNADLAALKDELAATRAELAAAKAALVQQKEADAAALTAAVKAARDQDAAELARVRAEGAAALANTQAELARVRAADAAALARARNDIDSLKGRIGVLNHKHTEDQTTIDRLWSWLKGIIAFGPVLLTALTGLAAFVGFRIGKSSRTTPPTAPKPPRRGRDGTRPDGEPLDGVGRYPIRGILSEADLFRDSTGFDAGSPKSAAGGVPAASAAAPSPAAEAMLPATPAANDNGGGNPAPAAGRERDVQALLKAAAEHLLARSKRGEIDAKAFDKQALVEAIKAVGATRPDAKALLLQAVKASPAALKAA